MPALDIKEFIKQKRPTLSASSVTTYASILRSLYKKVFGNKEFDPDDFEKTTEVLKYLADLPPNRRKSILSGLVVITNNTKYRDQMLEDIKEYNKEISLQKKSEAQEESWVTEEDIKAVYADLKRNADALYKKTNKTVADLQQIQNYIILSLLGGVIEGYPVRRSKDYCDFRIRNIDKTKHNYLEGNTAHFNSYKTAKFYNEQQIAVPTKLKNILKKWIALNPTDYLLFDANLNPLTSVKLNQRIQRIFDGKKVGVNGLRHSILTEKFGDTIAKQKEIAKVMSDMGSSPAQLTTYVKDD